VIGPPEEPNGEGIAFTPDSRGYFTVSEGENPALHLFLAIPRARFAGLPEKTGGGWSLTITGCAGSTVTVSRSADLLNWVPVQTINLSNSAATIVDRTVEEVGFYWFEH